MLGFGALEIDDLVTLGQDFPTLVPHHGLNEANPSRPMNDPSRGFQMVPGLARR